MRLGTTSSIEYFHFGFLSLSISTQAQVAPNLSKTYPASELTTPVNALQHYLHNGDTTFHWELKDQYETTDAKVFNLLLIALDTIR